MVSDQFQRAGAALQEGWPLPANSVHPPALVQTIAGQRVHPDQLTPEMVEPFVPLAKEIDQDNDPRLAMCMSTLAEAMSIQSAAIWLLDNRPWDFFAVYFDAIDHFCHGFMRYHPPQQAWISARDFELYHNVVSAAYQFHDRALGALVERAGQDATVVLLSDHGFHPDHLRPASIPDVPAGPAVEHRALGILAIVGPGIKKGEALHGPSVLDIAPTILALYGLPVGEDMDGKVLSQAFLEAPAARSLPSWDAVPGNDGRHPPHMRLDLAAARAALEQMIALGYIDRPDEDTGTAVEKTIRELRFNLGEAYQDADRHIEAHEIFSELSADDPDEVRFAVRRFVSAEALGMREEIQRIANDLDGRRRALFEESRAKIDALLAIERARGLERAETDGAQEQKAGAAQTEPEPLLTEKERRELARWRDLARYQPGMAEYLRARVLAAEKRYSEALAVLEGMAEGREAPPALLGETADLCRRLRRWSEARKLYERTLELDPDNPQAHIGLCRIALGRRKYASAARSALEALQRVHHYPLAHFLLGQALAGMNQYEQAADAFRAAISCNPNFPEAHTRLAALLEEHLGDAEAAREHRLLARRMRRRRDSGPARRAATQSAAEVAQDLAVCSARDEAPAAGEMPPLQDSLAVVTGLPRSGTSLLMQMLAAGGLSVLSDDTRLADDGNPRGYLEYAPVKGLLKDADFLRKARGKAVKIVAPLVAALPPDLPCRVILSLRDLDEVLDSQERMLARSNQPSASTPQRREMLKEEYARMLGRVKATLSVRPHTQLLVIQHRDTIADAPGVATKLNRFLGGGLDVAKMAAAIDTGLYRSRAHAGDRSGRSPSVQ